MNNLLTKFRYWMWGKAIQDAMRRSEAAGREAAHFAIGNRNKELEYLLGDLKNQLSEPNISKIAYQKLCDMSFAVNPEKILTAVSDREGKAVQIKLGNRVLTKTEIRNLQEQVRFYRDSLLIEVLQNTPKDKAQQIMFTKSENYEDMRSGKMLIFAIDIQEKILKAIESFDAKTK